MLKHRHSQQSKRKSDGLLRRDATNRQIAIDQRKRREIERAKQAELDHERSKLQNWQDGVGDPGDESDCEDTNLLDTKVVCCLFQPDMAAEL
jgi:hypothetical protein